MGVVQLTLPTCETGALAEEVACLSRRWSRRFGDGGHLRTAARATSARFAEWGGRALSAREQQRVRAYFDAVARRSLARDDAPSVRLARRKLVEASIVADLCAAGWDTGRASAEAQRATVGAVRGTAA